MADDTNTGAIKDILATGKDMTLVGGSIAALVALARMYSESRRQRKLKKNRETAHISPDTVVLRVKKPSTEEKIASACNRLASLKSCTETVSVKPSGTRFRSMDGRFVSDGEAGVDVTGRTEEKKAEDLFNTVGADTAKLLTGGFSLVGGYYLVSKLARKLEQLRLQRQVEAAQSEYIGLLDQDEDIKVAGDFSRLFSMDLPDSSLEMDKQAGAPTDIINLFKHAPRVARQGLAATLASYILLAGGSAYVVKKYLDSRYGSKDEEKPEEPIKIMLKANEARREITPEQMLATVALFRDGISDSTPSSIKQAAWEPDYSFLDKLTKTDAGAQQLLDMYAGYKGLDRRSLGEQKLPWTTRLKYSRTLSDIVKHPETHMGAIKDRLMSLASKDPHRWIDILNAPRNKDLLDMLTREQVNNAFNRGGLLGLVGKIPVLGDTLKNIASAYYTSPLGQGPRTEHAFRELGLGDEAAASAAKYHGFNIPPVAPSKLNKKADFDSSLMAWLSRQKTLSDITNKDLLQAIEDIKTPDKRKTKKQLGQNVEISFDDELSSVLSEEDKRKIMSHLAKAMK